MGFETVEGLITINATLPLQILHFIILMFILDKILFRPILNVINERRMFIETKKKELTRIKEEAERLSMEFSKMEHEAKVKAAVERAKLREQSLKEAEKLLEESRQKVVLIKQEAEKKIQAEIENAKPMLMEHAKTVAEEIIKKIIGNRAIAGIIFFLVLYIIPSIAFAQQEEPSKARIIYNNIMLFVNFGILVFLFVKYAKKPLLNFLKSEQNKIQEDISELEQEYNNAKIILNKQKDKLQNIEVYVDDIKKSILEMAYKERERIIKDAQKEADKMVEEAQLYYETESAKAKKVIAEDLVKMAVILVKEKLRKGIPDEVNDKIITNFIREIEKSARN